LTVIAVLWQRHYEKQKKLYIDIYFEETFWLFICKFKVEKWWPNIAFHLMYCSLNRICLKTGILWMEIFMGRTGSMALLKVNQVFGCL